MYTNSCPVCTEHPEINIRLQPHSCYCKAFPPESLRVTHGWDLTVFLWQEEWRKSEVQKQQWAGALWASAFTERCGGSAGPFAVSHRGLLAAANKTAAAGKGAMLWYTFTTGTLLLLKPHSWSWAVLLHPYSLLYGTMLDSLCPKAQIAEPATRKKGWAEGNLTYKLTTQTVLFWQVSSRTSFFFHIFHTGTISSDAHCEENMYLRMLGLYSAWLCLRLNQWASSKDESSCGLTQGTTECQIRSLHARVHFHFSLCSSLFILHFPLHLSS